VVEYHKGRGLIRYFRKRADNPWRYALAVALSPLILVVSVMRPALRSIFGQTRGKGK
jgi:N-acetylglucosaminyl-diphospho-decaprenol L-rhamnosyltransferase